MKYTLSTRLIILLLLFLVNTSGENIEERKAEKSLDLAKTNQPNSHTSFQINLKNITEDEMKTIFSTLLIKRLNEQKIDQQDESKKEEHIKKMIAEDGPVIEIKNETKDGEEKDQINYKTNQRKLNETNKFLPEWDSRISRIVCQFFIFGTLFGVVCSISACTCLLQPNHGGENNFSRNEPRLSIAPPVEENTKPIRIQFLEDGYCYATEMANNEIPPLPDYKSALKMPCDVFSILNRQISTIVGQPQTSEESGWLVPSYSNHHFHEKVDDAKLLTNVDSTLNDHVTDISNELVNCENNSQK